MVAGKLAPKARMSTQNAIADRSSTSTTVSNGTAVQCSTALETKKLGRFQSQQPASRNVSGQLLKLSKARGLT